MAELKISTEIEKLLVCPACRAEMVFVGGNFRCVNINCGYIFPVVEKTPILISDNDSIFSIADFVNKKDTFLYSSPHIGKLSRFLIKFMPSISKNFLVKKKSRRFHQVST